MIICLCLLFTAIVVKLNLGPKGIAWLAVCFGVHVYRDPSLHSAYSVSVSALRVLTAVAGRGWVNPRALKRPCSG